MAADPKLTKDLLLQTTDGSQCVSWKAGSQLTYLGQDCKSIPPILINLYASVATRLDMSFCSLTTLRGLESFTCLQEVILDNNLLDDDCTFPPSDSIITLSMNKNQFDQMDSLLDKLAHSYPKLRFLSLHGNPGCPDQISRDADDSEYKNYRLHAIHKLPGLSFLDSKRISDQERLEAFRRAQFIAFVIKPTEEQISRHDNEELILSGLPSDVTQTERNQQQHSAVYGKLKYRYTGKHSEGNRFIRNNQL